MFKDKWAIPEKKQQEGLKAYFFEPPAATIVLHPSDILKPKTKIPGNST